PPGDDGQGPEEHLEVGTSRGHPEALPLLGEEPGVAHVTVEGELEVDEQESHLVDVPSESLAGQAVRELVRCGDRENDEPCHQDHLDTPEALEVPGDVTPLGHSDAEPECDGGRGEHEEGRREKEADFADQPVQEAVGVEGAQPQIEGAPTSPSAPGGRTVERCLVGLDQPEAPERRDETFDHPRLRHGPERLAGPPADDVERSGAVELARDEMLRLAEAEESPRRRILQDDRAVLPADHEIASELWLRGYHRRTLIPFYGRS